MKENNKGITLLVLTITVILMLIIASTATYYGISAYDNARLTKFETELRVMQAKVELWEEEGKTDIGTELTGDQKNVLNNIYNTDKIDYYRYLSAQDINDLGIDGIEQDFFVIVQLPEITSTFNLTNLYDLLKYRVISAQGLTYRGTTYYTLYELQENDLLASPYSIVPKDAVASLTNKTTEQVTIYSSVQEAVNAAGNSPSIVTLLKDYTEEKEIKTEVGQSIILDINQYTLEVEKPINNNGTLTINGNGIIVNETDFVIKNNDILNIENGEITGCEGILNTSAGKIHITGGTIKGNFNGIPTESGGTLVTRGIMNFGTLIVNEATIEGLYAIYNNSNATAIVNGGTIIGNNAGINNQGITEITKSKIASTSNGIGNYLTGTVSVIGGTIESKNNGIYNNSTGTITVSETIVKGDIYGIYNNSTGGAITITGGTIIGTSSGINNTGRIEVQNATITANIGINNYSTGTITVKETAIIGEISDGIKNSSTGTVSITKGKITGNENGIKNSSTGTVSITEGKITGSTDGIQNTSTGTITVKDATIIGESSDGIKNSSTGTVSITGGTIKGNFNGIPTESGGTLVTTGIQNKGILTVDGATIEGRYAIYNNSNATAIVNGGTISGNNYGIYNQSTLTIFKGTITGNIGIYNTKSVTVAEGIIQGNTHGIYNNSVEAVLITGGTISGNNYGIYNHSTGTVTIGSDEKLLDKTFPVVSGSSTKSNSRAVYSLNTSSIINFFNGVLKGTASTPYYISGTLNPRMGYTPITTTTVDSDGYYLTTLELDENAVASLTDTSTGKITNYTTVQGAIDAANTNESTVTLLKDVITEDVTVGVNISNHYSNGTITINAGTITGTITGTTLGIYNYNNLATIIKNGGNVSP